MNERVTITVEAGIADVRLNRPEKRNALDPAMFAALRAAGAALSGMAGLRVAVLSGSGPAFCAGLDVASFADESFGSAADLAAGAATDGIANGFQQVAWQWRTLGIPVIAAIHGVCFGGGLQIASGADIRIVSPDARLAIREMHWGIVADMAGHALWRGLLRDDVLRELVYTAREVAASEAVAIGLATRIADDPLAEAMALANDIAARSPDAVRAAKRLANAMADSDAAVLLRLEEREQVALLGGPNQKEAAMAAQGRRPPQFSD